MGRLSHPEVSDRAGVPRGGASVPSPGSALDRVVDFARSLRLAEVDPGVVGHARLIVLDTLGAIIAGSGEEEVRRLAAGMDGVVRAGSSVVGIQACLPPSLAAFLNGTAGTWHEMDEGNYPTHQHPAIHVVPPALALAEHLGRDGSGFLEAVIAGYEVGGRAGMATRLRDSVMHPHGTHGIVGGATAAALLSGSSKGEFREALNIATSMSVATSRPTVFEGATVRNSYAGQACQNAVLAAAMARSGFTGERDGLGSVFGKVSGESFDHSRLVEGLGEDFILTRNYFKLYACCAYNHATLEALSAALARTRPAPEEVESVEVHTYFPATRVVRDDAANLLASKFSIPYAVSAMLVTGGCGPEAFSASVRADPAVRSLMPRVRVVEDRQATSAYPTEQRASVTVELADGSRLSGRVDRVRGDHRAPVPPARIEEKFRAVAAPVIGDARTDALVRSVEGLGDGTSPAAIGALLRGEGS